MHLNHFLYGKKKAGYTKMTLEDGSNGIVDIIEEDGMRMTKGK